MLFLYVAFQTAFVAAHFVTHLAEKANLFMFFLYVAFQKVFAAAHFITYVAEVASLFMILLFSDSLRH